MKEHKTPLEYLKEHEGILPKTVGLAILCRLMEEYSDQQNAELKEKLRIETQKAKAFGNALDIATKDELALKERVKELEGLMQEFVDRVDRGEVRSKRTYSKFKAALKK